MHQAATNRLDAVTIRIGLADDQTERAPEALGLPSIRQLPATGKTEPALDLMEVSRRSLPAEAGFLYPALAASMRRRGLDPASAIQR